MNLKDSFPINLLSIGEIRQLRVDKGGRSYYAFRPQKGSKVLEIARDYKVVLPIVDDESVIYDTYFSITGENFIQQSNSPFLEAGDNVIKSVIPLNEYFDSICEHRNSNSISVEEIIELEKHLKKRYKELNLYFDEYMQDLKEEDYTI